MDRIGRNGPAIVAAVGLTATGFVAAAVLFALSDAVLAGAGVPVRQQPVDAVVRTVTLPVGFAAVALVYGRGTDAVDIDARTPSSRDRRLVVAGVVALLVALVALDAGARWAGLPAPDHGLIGDLVDAERLDVLLLLAPLSVLFTGPGEELLFRGAIQGRLRAAFGPAPAIGGACALFAAVHLPAFAGPGAGVAIAQVFVLSSLLGAAYELTDNIVVPALIHGLFNAVQFLVVYADGTGVA
jgi:membrane protease YdiL (CAAX protease family)